MPLQKLKEKLSSRLLNWILLISCALIWGFSYFLIKHSLAGFEPLQVAGIRIVMAALCLLPFACIAFIKIPRNKYGYVLLCALAGNGIPMYLYPLAQTHISSSVTGIINSFTPLCIYITGILFFGMANHKSKLTGVLLGLLGVICLIAFKPHTELKAVFLFIVVALFAPLLYGLNANIYKKHLSGLPGFPLTALMFFMLLLPSVPLLLFTGVPETIGKSAAAREALPYALLLGFAGTALAMSLFNILLRRANIMFAASVSYLMPVVAVTIGMIDNEHVGWYELLGLAMILSGVILINRVKN